MFSWTTTLLHRRVLPGLILGMILSAAVQADPPQKTPQEVKHQVTGLFCPERVDDLKLAATRLEGIELVRVDYETAEAVFRYDPVRTFPNAPPEKIIEQLDERIRNASRSTFGIKPLCATPRDQLTLIEIPVVGLDCKACSLAAYESIFKLPGVEQATASLRDGLVTARVHATQTDQKTLEQALTQRGVTLRNPPAPSP